MARTDIPSSPYVDAIRLSACKEGNEASYPGHSSDVVNMPSVLDGLDALWNRVGSADLKRRFIPSIMVTCWYPLASMMWSTPLPSVLAS